MHSLSDPQAAFVEHTGDFVLLLGGRQSGKTEAALRRAHRKAKVGEVVTYISPGGGQAKDASRRLKDIGSTNQAVVQNVSRNSIKYQSGGEVSFFNGSKTANIRGLHPSTNKEFIVDGVSYIDSDIVDMLCSASTFNGSVHCTTTPPTSDMPVVERLQDAGYQTVAMPTMSNPTVDPAMVQSFKQEGDSFERHFLIGGHKFNEHVLTVTNHGDARRVVCSLCEFEVRVPFSEADPAIAEATQYAFGAALDVGCA